MKKAGKLFKALIVILVVGIGLISNLNKSTGTFYKFSPFSVGIENSTEKNDSVKLNESRLYIFTKKIIDSGIKQFFPNL